MAPIPPRLLHLDHRRDAILAAALRAPHSLGDIDKPRVPAGDSGERDRVALAPVPAGAGKDDLVLAEFVGQPIDLEGHGADFDAPCRDASIQ